MMRALVVEEAGRWPARGHFPDPEPAPGHTVVEVTAAAITRLARIRAQGAHLPSSASFPFVPGADGVGRTPDGARVGFLLPAPPHGAFAERTLVPDAFLFPVPDGLDDAAAAALINAGQSGLVALDRRAGLRAGETVLVNGATGVTGSVAVQLAKRLGAGTVIATGRDRAALERLLRLGADHAVALDDADALAAAIEAAPPAVVLDYLSGAPAEQVLAAVAAGPAGPVRYVLGGTAAGLSTTVPTAALATRPLTLLGSGIGAVPLPTVAAAAGEALRLAAEQPIVLDLRRVDLADAAEAWTTADERIRTVVTIDRGAR